MSSNIEVVYLGRDNTIDKILKADGVAVDLSGVTKMELIFPDVIIGSDQNPDVFDWDEGGGKLVLALGGSLKNPAGEGTEIAAGEYDPYLIVYDAANTDGINWGIIRLKIY